MIQHFNVRVSGRVQGVYYRASARQEAERLGLKGFVRNEPDGSVYLEVEGEAAQLEQLLGWCRKGPRAANVELVEVTPGTICGFTTFEVRR